MIILAYFLSRASKRSLCYIHLMKPSVVVIAASVLVGLGITMFIGRDQFNGVKDGVILTPNKSASITDGTYNIDGQAVKLIAGSATTAVPDSASVITTRYFGNEVDGDFNGDGSTDTAFLLTQTTGGSGTFYYLAVALGTSQGYHGTNAVLLGDRIAPQTTEWRDGAIVVNFADRKPNEPMTAQPSVGVSKYFVVSSDGTLISK